MAPDSSCLSYKKKKKVQHGSRLRTTASLSDRSQSCRIRSAGLFSWHLSGAEGLIRVKNVQLSQAESRGWSAEWRLNGLLDSCFSTHVIKGIKSFCHLYLYSLEPPLPLLLLILLLTLFLQLPPLLLLIVFLLHLLDLLYFFFCLCFFFYYSLFI